jgi:hypothetical protein
MANDQGNGQPQGGPSGGQIAVNIAPLLEAQKHLRIVLQLVMSQPGVIPLDSVRIFAQGAEAVLSQALAEVTRSNPGILIPPAGLKV